MSTNGSSDAVTRILDAAVFAADKHQKCRRKDVDATPYINHPLRVAQILTESRVDEIDVIVAAILHDTVEDTDTSPEEIARRFGPVVAGLVAEVTDDKTVDKQERKDRQVESAPRKSNGARLIKLADKASNLEDLVARPPAWSRERIDEYRAWAAQVAAGCRGLNDALDRRVAVLCGVALTGASIEEASLHDPNADSRSATSELE